MVGGGHMVKVFKGYLKRKILKKLGLGHRVAWLKDQEGLYMHLIKISGESHGRVFVGN